MGRPTVDMTGRKFGRLAVVARAGSTPGGQARWLCRCECGAESVAAGTVLRARPPGGCFACTRPPRQDLTGGRFGCLLVLGAAADRRTPGRPGQLRAFWRCRCDCGREVEVAGNHLKAGPTHCRHCSPNPRWRAAGETGGGHHTARPRGTDDLTGRVFGRIVITGPPAVAARRGGQRYRFHPGRCTGCGAAGRYEPVVLERLAAGGGGCRACAGAARNNKGV